MTIAFPRGTRGDGLIGFRTGDAVAPFRSTFRTALASVPGALAAGVRALIAAQERYQQWQALRALDDRLLRDIGLTREQIASGLVRPDPVRRPQAKRAAAIRAALGRLAGVSGEAAARLGLAVLRWGRRVAERMADRRRERAVYAMLNALDDRALKDLGLSRCELHHAAASLWDPRAGAIRPPPDAATAATSGAPAPAAEAWRRAA